MDTHIAKEMIRVIRAERDRRMALANEDEYWADVWWQEELFINELCLALLVTIRHIVEKELVSFAAQVIDDDEEVQGRKKPQKQRVDWKALEAKLRLEKFSEWTSSMELLRQLANLYKHDPGEYPDEEILTHLSLDLSFNYATIQESRAFREGMAKYLDLQGGGADYCDIVDELLDRASGFLEKVKSQPELKLKPRKFFPVTWNPEDWPG